jgi:hypothetical protein
LRFVHEPPEGFAVHDAIAIALKARSNRVFRFWGAPAARIACKRGIGRQVRGLARFLFLSNG